MDKKDVSFFLKWLFSQPFAIFDKGFANEYVRDDIDNCLIPTLRMIKEASTLTSLENGLIEVYNCFPLFGPLNREVFRPGNYNAFIDFCSWELNCEYRKLYDVISEYSS